jgi:hypothetical protein
VKYDVDENGDFVGLSPKAQAELDRALELTRRSWPTREELLERERKQRAAWQLLLRGKARDAR